MTTRRAIHCFVHGRVQGVGFRAYVREAAGSLGVTGWVRNSEDGRTVELLAQGTAEALEALRERVAAGPAGSRVERVSCEAVGSMDGLNEFKIRR